MAEVPQFINLNRNIGVILGSNDSWTFCMNTVNKTPLPQEAEHPPFNIAPSRVDGTVGKVKAVRITLMAVLLCMALVLLAGHENLPSADVPV